MDKEYDALLSSYRRMFSMVDAIHFNSQNTADVYSEYIEIPSGSAVVPITHTGVADHRKARNFDGRILKLGFVGSEASYKGLPMLKRVIGALNEDGYSDIVYLDVYGGKTGSDNELANVTYKGRFGVNEMELVYDSMDLLIVPSIWCETFSLTTIEALQFGVPVLVSSKVGAKDIVKVYAPNFVFDSEEDLYILLKRLIGNRRELVEYNKAIVNSMWNYSMKEHADEIVKTFYRHE